MFIHLHVCVTIYISCNLTMWRIRQEGWSAVLCDVLWHWMTLFRCMYAATCHSRPMCSLIGILIYSGIILYPIKILQLCIVHKYGKIFCTLRLCICWNVDFVHNTWWLVNCYVLPYLTWACQRMNSARFLKEWLCWVHRVWYEIFFTFLVLPWPIPVVYQGWHPMKGVTG